MNNAIKYLILTTTVVLSGCASSPKLTADELAEANIPLICSDKAQCDLYWQRAQIWLVDNSKFKIQSTTDTVITTYGPAPYDPGLAYAITKIPDGENGATIRIKMGCGNAFGCTPKAENAALSFKRYVTNKNIHAPVGVPSFQKTSNWRPVNQ